MAVGLDRGVDVVAITIRLSSITSPAAFLVYLFEVHV